MSVDRRPGFIEIGSRQGSVPARNVALWVAIVLPFWVVVGVLVYLGITYL